MQLDVTLTPRELDRLDRHGHTVAVIDVVRASTTMVQGLAAGAMAFIPVPSVAAARRTAKSLGHDKVLLGGERGGVAVSGFNLGNSPLEYTPERVSGQTIVFTTTNGTAAIAAARSAQSIIIAAFVNLDAVVAYLQTAGTDVTIAAAGRLGRPALDDTICAGLIVNQLLEGGPWTPTDTALLARQSANDQATQIRELLSQAASGQALKRLALEADLDFCAQLNLYNLVPRVEEGRVVISVP